MNKSILSYISVGNILVFLLVFRIFGAVPLSAQSSSEQDDLIIVTGSKFEETTDESTEKVEVITKEEIEDSGASNLSDLLNQIPGIQADGHAASSIMIQGFEGDYAKILIDGIEIIGRINGAIPASQIPLSSIERIEIIRGASSALYGSDAISGVVNIITKRKKVSEPEFSADLSEEFSTNLHNITTGALAYSTENFRFGFSGSLDYDNGKTEIQTTSNGDFKAYFVPFNRLGSIRATADWYGDSGKWGLYSSYTNFYNISSDLDTYEDQSIYKTTSVDGGFTGERQIGDRLSISGFLSGKYYYLDINDHDLAEETNDYTKRTFLGTEGEFRAEYSPSISHTFLFGSNINYDALVDHDNMDGDFRSMLLWSAFAQDSWNIGALDRFILAPGLRIDYSPKLASDDSHLFQVTPKLSFKTDISDSTILRASYGMGYKIPTLLEKYYVYHHTHNSTDFYVYGNPNLKPETSHGINLSMEQKIREILALSASGYFNRVKNLIETQISGSNYTYENVDKALTYGGDVKIKLTLNNYTGSISYAYTRALGYDDYYGIYEDLTGRVPHSINIDSSYSFELIGLRIFGTAIWEAPRIISKTQYYTYKSPDKLLFFLGVEKTLGEYFEVYIRGDNVLNNLHFIKGSGGAYEGMSQEEYFEVYDGFTMAFGGRLKY